MCGVVGWVDFDRRLYGEHASLRLMTATMALRGPDAEGVWLDEHVGLGHRRLAVIDLPGGVQPMTVEHDGAVLAVLTYSGEVYNFRELRQELQGHGHRFRTNSDTEVVLRAYLQWGEAFVERLNGMFAFGLWDCRQEKLVLARDRMGVKPLYYYPTPHGVLFASEPKGILAHHMVPTEVDTDGLRAALTHIKTPGENIYRGVYEVRPGHLMVLDRAGRRERAYWSLRPREHADDLDTTVATVRELLTDIMTRQMIADVPVCTLLSGGLDSSTVTALAARVPRAGEGPVRSFAVDFVGQTENFQPDAMRETPDAPFARAVAAHVGALHAEVVLDAAKLMDPLYRGGALSAHDAPGPMGDMTTSAYLLFGAVREHSTVALSGESADEVFGGYRWFHEPQFVNAPTFPWLAAQNWSNGCVNPLVEILDPDVAAGLDLPGYEQQRYREALDEVEHLPRENPTDRRMREVFYLHLTRWVQVLLDRKDRLSMAHGLEVRVPFCDHRLVDYVYNIPWSMKTFDGREKSLIRAAAEGLLPDSVLQRKKSPYPSTQDLPYVQMLQARATEIAAADGAPTAGLLNTKRIRQILEAPLESSGFGPNRRRIEMVISLDNWLRRYPVRLTLD
jgi:asparagine synthase (glutamine-hydrolysing)